MDLRLGADQSLDSRLARVASLAFSDFPTVSLPLVPLGRWLLSHPVTSPILLWAAAHHQAITHPAPTIKSAPRLARHPSGPWPAWPPLTARSSCDLRCRPQIRKIGEYYVGSTTTTFPGAGPQFPRGKGGDSAC